MEWNIFPPRSFDVKISLELHVGAALQIAWGRPTRTPIPAVASSTNEINGEWDIL